MNTCAGPFREFLSVHCSNEASMIGLLQGPIAIRLAKLAIDQGIEVRLHVTYLAKNKELFSCAVFY